MKQQYGQLIQTFRKKRGISQKELAQGISSQPTLSCFEAGKGYVPAETLIQYLKRLRIHPTEFFMLVEDDPFSEYQYFHQVYEEATQEKQARDDLIAHQQARFDATHDETFSANIILTKLAYAKNHQLSLEPYEADMEWMRNYFSRLDDWHLSDIEWYISVLFIFNTYKLQKHHDNFVQAVQRSPFANDRKKWLLFGYTNNLLILMFERLALENVPEYLEQLKMTISSEPSDLHRAVAYSAFSQLYRLVQHFSSEDLKHLLQELDILRRYHYEEEYRFYQELIMTTLQRNGVSDSMLDQVIDK
jgi:transcriptional regulator with XRE-family HTH domain